MLGVWGLLFSYIIEPSVPAEALIGKSQSYILGYSEAYKKAVKNKQGKDAIIGCLVGTGVSAALYVVYFVLVLGMASSASRY